MKADILLSAKSVKEFLNIDLEKKVNLKPLHEVVVGYGVRRATHGSAVPKQSEKNVFRIQIRLRTILKHITLKLEETSSLQYPLARAIGSMHPCVISSNNTVAVKCFKMLCDQLRDAGRLAAVCGCSHHLLVELLVTAAF